MTNPTVNRAYTMPASTDLVTDLPADFAVFGDAVDLDISSCGGYTTVATAAGTTTLTITSNRNQRFTGVTTQTVTMPVASTLAVGARWKIQNKSTGIVTVQSSGANTIYAIPAATTAEFVCILASGTTAASWDYDWEGATTAPTSGALKFLTGASFSAVASVSLPNDTFTATYDNYKIIITIDSGTAAALTLRMRASGTDNSAANYLFAQRQTNWYVTAADVTSGASPVTAFGLGTLTSGAATTDFEIGVINPYIAKFLRINYLGTGGDQSGRECSIVGVGFHNTNTVFDALTFLIASGTITGTYRVYGYANS